MNQKELFAPILQNDEEIIKTFKPNKKRFVVISGIFASFGFLIIAGLCSILMVLGFTGKVLDEDGNPDKLAAWIGLGLVIFFLLAIVLYWIVRFVEYKKVVYAYTNKRILIRRGFIGTDYATLDFDLIGGLMVNVGLFDKFIKASGGTGTITFGSAASPVINTGNAGAAAAFVWRNVDDPYGTYREIKEIIDSSKAKK
ncbi:MAG: PH domain-containing protein [Bacilli bacterium]|nr:PH domain-containing protein [Bacilli bacterium]